jgi:hypothetical protein
MDFAGSSALASGFNRGKNVVSSAPFQANMVRTSSLRVGEVHFYEDINPIS